ncbi:MAG: hypothetical protein ACI4R9_03460 [Kiritimatiellia bacterium]
MMDALGAMQKRYRARLRLVIGKESLMRQSTDEAAASTVLDYCVFSGNHV